MVVSSTGEDIQLSLLSSMSEDVKQQETPIEGKLKIGLPASASVSSSHDKKNRTRQTPPNQRSYNFQSYLQCQFLREMAAKSLKRAAQLS